MKRVSALAACLLVAPVVPAQEVRPDQQFGTRPYYGGVGVANNSVSGAEDAGGYQIFGGYAFDVAGLSHARVAAEGGYWKSGEFERNDLTGNQSSEFEADGAWGNAVLSYPLSEKWRLLGRAGLGVGDDDGLMVGGGLGYRADRHVELRGEVVERDNIESLQANVVFRF